MAERRRHKKRIQYNFRFSCPIEVSSKRTVVTFPSWTHYWSLKTRRSW
ncbi:SEC62 isoform 9 [Pan troglodytes]|uniref:SEC62 homolog, preprotein translocation factor n=2 Tax=Homininae TaxID=207598 RepID=F8WDG8_HUMAN|nr:SEC62 isoform 9 [Pan troglodytes]